MARHLFSMPVAIDPGTAYTRVFRCGRGNVLCEPSLCAVSQEDKTDVFFGSDAFELVGRSPAGVKAVRPIREGIVAEVSLTCAMLKHFSKLCGTVRLRRMRAVVVVPSGSTELSRQAIEDAVYAAGAAKVKLVEKTLAAAIGAGIDPGDCSGHMVVDIGAGLAEASVVSRGGIVVARSTRSGGNAMDDQIVKLMRFKKGLAIGERTAEKLKLEMGSASAAAEECVPVRGRDQKTGLPVSGVVSADEICEAIKPVVFDIVAMVRDVLSMTPPELSADLMDRGILLTGGGARLMGLDDVLSAATGLPVKIAEDCELCCVLGAARYAGGNADAMKRDALPALPVRV